MKISWLISRYLITSVTPYFVAAWLLLSVILFVQQASRFSDIFFSLNIPTNLIWQLSVALVPNVIAFTCPVAMLVGTIIGLTKMQRDSEIIAIRAAGVGHLQIAVPILVLGLILSVFAFLVNLKGVPLAAGLVRSVALQTAIKKLESPVEPGVFNTEIAGSTVYVRGGDFDTGRWTDIFIYSEDVTKGTLRLITSQNGRLDFSGQNSELVLENAAVSTIPRDGAGEYVSEILGEIRFAIRTKRSELLEKLTTADLTIDELGLKELTEFAASKEGSERVEAQILVQRRLLLSITPLIFSVLALVIVLRFKRGVRGMSIAISLLSLIIFYFFAFLGEQLVRLGVVPLSLGALLPIVLTLGAAAWLGLSRRVSFFDVPIARLKSAFRNLRQSDGRKIRGKNLFVDLTTGLRDFDLARNLIKNFFLTLGFLTAMFLIFTAFDLWKFAGSFDGGTMLLAKYLYYLLPFVYLQIAASAAMVSTLATYVIKSRQNEIITWTAAGQSVYRLLLPCFVLTILLGAISFAVQELVLPEANRRQDEIRSTIRNRGIPGEKSGRTWAVRENRIYSYFPASDNEKQLDMPNAVGRVSVFEFDRDRRNLQSVYRASQASWENGRVLLEGSVERFGLENGNIVPTNPRSSEIYEPSNPFLATQTKPAHLNRRQLAERLEIAEADIEKRGLRVALEKKYTTPLVALIVALFTAPFSLSLSRTGKAATVGLAVGLWLLFTGTTNVFEQLGQSGLLEPRLAVWSPLVVFAFLGIYLLGRVRT